MISQMAEFFPSVLKSQYKNCPNREEFDLFQEHKTAAPDSFNKIKLQNNRSFSLKNAANTVTAWMTAITQTITYMIFG